MSKKEQAITGADRQRKLFEQSASKKKVQPVTSEQEKAERRATGRTQGRTGCKMSRINFALTVENNEYVRKMSKARGENMTEFINHCIEKHREEHAEDYERFMEFISKT